MLGDVIGALIGGVVIGAGVRLVYGEVKRKKRKK
jgi:hypothetical protein